jgi:hypothetical protein
MYIIIIDLLSCSCRPLLFAVLHHVQVRLEQRSFEALLAALEVILVVLGQFGDDRRVTSQLVLRVVVDILRIAALTLVHVLAFLVQRRGRRHARRGRTLLEEKLQSS